MDWIHSFCLWIVHFLISIKRKSCVCVFPGFTCGMMKLSGHKASNFPRGVQQTLSLDATQGVTYCESLCLNQACALFTYQPSSRRCTLADQLSKPIEDSSYDVYVKRCPGQIGDQRKSCSSTLSRGTFIFTLDYLAADSVKQTLNHNISDNCIQSGQNNATKKFTMTGSLSKFIIILI